jgi:MFS family permease
MQLAMRNTLLLSLCQGLYLSAQSTQAALSSLVGALLAPDRMLATVPLSLIVLTNAVTTIPASFFMARFGRRTGFMLGALIGGTGGLLSTWALFQHNFVLFCIGNALMGCFQSVAQYYRFAAADAVGPEAKARAVSLVMAGGVAAAVLGPSIAAYAKDLLLPVPFAGAYVAISVLAALSILILSFVALPPPPVATGSARPGRGLAEIARQPAFIAALANIVLGYVTMNFVMTATPLAAVGCGYGTDDAIGIIRLHLVGMFAPGLFTGSLILRFGLLRIILAGAVAMFLALAIALSGTELVRFWVALSLLGLGWNFMYVGGTTLLTKAYRQEERAKVQAASEFSTFGAVALASFASGGVFAGFGWATVIYTVLPLMIIAVATTGWYAAVDRRAPIPAE